MDEEAVRARAQALCEAIVAGDIDRAIEDFSQELREHLGEVIALLPLPASEATIESIEHSGSGDNVVLRLVGESEEVLIQTRWKDRDGKPTVIEASHLTSTRSRLRVARNRLRSRRSSPPEGSGKSGSGPVFPFAIGTATGRDRPFGRRRVQLRLRRGTRTLLPLRNEVQESARAAVGRLPLIGLVMGSLP